MNQKIIAKKRLTVSRSWRHVKEDFLHHFSLPCLDLLVWVLVTKLAPTYYRKLDGMLNDKGCFRELPKWRKHFKFDWMVAMRTPITQPMNEKYRPDTKNFTCTCPEFVVSQFLLCKHIVQQFHPVDPRFFLKVTRNRTLPIWSHPALKPLITPADATELVNPTTILGGVEDKVSDRQNMARYELEEGSDDDSGIIDTEMRGDTREAYNEKMEHYIRTIRDFCEGLEYQIKFRDPWFLITLEKDGAGFFRLAENCLSREQRLNSS